MAYDAPAAFGAVLTYLDAPPDRAAKRFGRTERLVLLIGASAFGGLVGLTFALAVGRWELWAVALTGAPVLVLALHLTAETLRDALRRDARGCAGAACMHVAALLAWPMLALSIPLGALNFFIAPGLALATLALFASCWGGPSRVAYRIAAQGALVAAVAAHQGIMVVMT